MDEVEDTSRYSVLRNAEEQYSIWLQELPVPSGWTHVGVDGTKAECLAHIERVWTDLTPLSVRSRREPGQQA